MGLGMITDGAITKKRVFAPEGAIDPMEFLRHYSRHWMSPAEDGGLLEEWVEELVWELRWPPGPCPRRCRGMALRRHLPCRPRLASAFVRRSDAEYPPQFGFARMPLP